MHTGYEVDLGTDTTQKLLYECLSRLKSVLYTLWCIIHFDYISLARHSFRNVDTMH